MECLKAYNEVHFKIRKVVWFLFLYFGIQSENHNIYKSVIEIGGTRHYHPIIYFSRRLFGTSVQKRISCTFLIKITPLYMFFSLSDEAAVSTTGINMFHFQGNNSVLI